MSTQNTAVRAALSAERMATYEAVTTDTAHAVRLYAWNAQVSAAFMAPLHLCEVVTRNAVSDAITALYGAGWPWSNGFRQSLSDPPQGYSPRRDLVTVSGKQPSTGKVIPELKFVFWERMFTARYDHRLWKPYLGQVMPHAPAQPIKRTRRHVAFELESIRGLRNRIAHHEPIFARNLQADLSAITDLIRLRCSLTADWMLAHEDVSALLAARP